MIRRLTVLALLLALAGRAAAQGCTCASPLVTGEEPCCTYTRGWWRNHHVDAKGKKNKIAWPQPCDPLFNGEASHVFTGFTAYEILETPPSSGDMCFILGAQFVAATMNECKGACAESAVTEALTRAWEILQTPGLCPGGLTSSTNHTALRAEANNVKNVLDDYNNGEFYGPGHCDSEAPNDCPVYTCDGGCTLTQGYWKTHSANGKGKNNMPWDDGTGTCAHSETSIVFGTTTWFDALITAPDGGNACLIAAKQYVAAKLNIDCNGACVPDVFVADALACVKEGLDSAFCPGLTPGNGALTAVEKVERAKILSCASTLDAYNNGYLLGPGHCEDDDLAAGLVAGVEGAEEEAQSTSPNGDSGMLVATLVFAIFACLAACLAAYAAMTKGPYAKV